MPTSSSTRGSLGARPPSRWRASRWGSWWPGWPRLATRAYAVPIALAGSALTALGVLAILPEAAPLAELLMQAGLVTIAVGTSHGAALSFWSQRRSGWSFPRSGVPPVLARLCASCGALAVEVVATCTSCGAPQDADAWERDTPEPLLAFLIALVATGAALFVLGSLGSGEDGFGAFLTHFLLGASVTLTVAITALAWAFCAHVIFVSRRGSVGYLTSKSQQRQEHRAVARVDRDGAIASAAGSSRVRSKKRFVPPLSMAKSEDGRQVIRALRKLAAHDKLAVRTLRRITWRRGHETRPTTDDYRTAAVVERESEESEEPYVFAAREEGAGGEHWSQGIGLEAGGSSPLGAYLSWIEEQPTARAWLIEAAAAIEAEEEAAEEPLRREQRPEAGLSRLRRS